MMIDFSLFDQEHTAVVPLGDVLWSHVDESDRTALVLPDAEFSYGDLIAQSVAVARALMASGVARGDRVGLLMPGSAEFITAFFGASMAGAVVVPINTRYKQRELEYVVADAGLVGVLSTDLIDDHVDLLRLVTSIFARVDGGADPGNLRLDGFPQLRFVVNLGSRPAKSALGRDEFLARGESVTPRDFDRRRRAVKVRDEVAVFYTSGTTTEPKGCVHTHESLVRNWQEIGRRLGFTAQDALWAPCPIFHLSGIGPILGAFLAGSAVITATHLDVDAIMRSFARMRPTLSYALFPQIIADVLEALGPDADVLGDIRVAVQVGTSDQMYRFHETFPTTRFVQVYGLTESAGLVTLGAPEDSLASRCEKAGTVLPGSALRIVDPASGQICSVGESGELQFLSYSCCEGYHADAAKSSESLTADGWFRTGDRGVLDADQQLTFLGRIKDMLKVGGENVAAVEIEARLDAHPAVKMSQVVGVPDDRLGEVPFAFVELRDGHDANAMVLIEHCRGHMASFKVPRRVEIVETWPMSSTKIQKFKLRERAKELVSDHAGTGPS